jgi:hypothetical protein
MRTQKWLGQGLAPAPKLGLVSCLCVTALSWPVGLLSEARAQASARRDPPPPTQQSYRWKILRSPLPPIWSLLPSPRLPFPQNLAP